MGPGSWVNVNHNKNSNHKEQPEGTKLKHEVGKRLQQKIWSNERDKKASTLFVQSIKKSTHQTLGFALAFLSGFSRMRSAKLWLAELLDFFAGVVSSAGSGSGSAPRCKG